MTEFDPDADLLRRVIGLAMDVAARGERSALAYLAGEPQLTQDNFQGMRDMTTRGMVEARRLVDRTQSTSPNDHALESAVIDLAKAIAPRVSLSLARLVTGELDRPDEGSARKNLVVTLRELGSMVTKLLNDSVGGSDAATLAAFGPQRGDVIRLTQTIRPGESTTFDLPILNEAWSPAETDGVERIVTPFIGTTHTLTGGHLDLPPTIDSQRAETATLHFDGETPAGRYRGSIFLLAGGKLITSVDLELVLLDAAAGVQQSAAASA